jgi:hypothetical protein
MARIFDFQKISTSPKTESFATKLLATHRRTTIIKNREPRLFTTLRANPFKKQSL